MGSLRDLNKKSFEEELNLLKRYQELGSPEEILTRFNVLKKYMDIGTVYEIKEVYIKASSIIEILGKYKALGTIDEIKAKIRKLKN
jgi:hypothetical protein